jgi:hypothetical protein
MLGAGASALVVVSGRRRDPVLGIGEQVGAAALPRPRRRRADEVDPHPDAARDRLSDQRLDPHVTQRTAVGTGKGDAQPLGRRPHLGIRRRAGRHPPPPRAPRGAHPIGERPVVARRDEVDRRAHQRRLHDRPALERAGQDGALEALHPRPEPDVHRGRVLRLDPAQRSSVPGKLSAWRSSSPCRASSARFSARAVRTRGRRAATLSGARRAGRRPPAPAPRARR